MIKSNPNRQMRFIILLSGIITFGQTGPFSDSSFSFASSVKNASNAEKSPPGQKVRYNRLIYESSPYLLQHATNPVKWYPWEKRPLKQQKKKTNRFFYRSDTPPVTGAM